jgi:hypothetical protein
MGRSQKGRFSSHLTSVHMYFRDVLLINGGNTGQDPMRQRGPHFQAEPLDFVTVDRFAQIRSDLRPAARTQVVSAFLEPSRDF